MTDRDGGGDDNAEAAVGDLWPAPSPPPDFIDRVMTARAAERRAARQPFGGRQVVRWTLAAGAAMVLLLLVWRAPWRMTAGVKTSSQLVTTRRTSIDVGPRARAVAEPGSQLSYQVEGRRVTVRQRAGDVFYRVDGQGGDAGFTVTTGAGEVRVRGTCFRVADALTANSVVVSVLEGRVELANAHGSIWLDAGEKGVLSSGARPRVRAAPEGERTAPAPVVAPPAAPPAPVRRAAVRSATGRGRDGALADAQVALAPPPAVAPEGRLAPPPPAGRVAEAVTLHLRFVETGAEPALVGGDPDDLTRIADPVLALYARELRDQLFARWRPLAGDARPGLQGATPSLGPGRTTTVRARIGHDGRLVSAELEASSGIEPIDEAAQATLTGASSLPRPPSEILDDFGQYEVRLQFQVDLRVSDYLARVGREVAARWRPRLTFQRFARPEQIVVVRVLVSPAGVVERALLAQSSGISYLDDRALGALAVGTRLPGPPPALRSPSGLMPLRVMFAPSVSNDFRVLAVRDPAGSP